jgi:6-oxo-cyclohex-1-ene-carbonyl-CoA hydrolase
MMLNDHRLVPDFQFKHVLYERRALRDTEGRAVEGLWNVWISLDNPSQLNSYTTEMVKEVILAFRHASMERDVVSVVFTGVGDRAFCSGGNTREYAEIYAGGQEIGMACDFSIAADTAVFGQAGPKHGSAPDGGSTDFLPLYVGFARAMESCTLCETWSAHMAMRLGLINEVAPVLREHGDWISNPEVVTESWLSPEGRIVYGEFRSGDERTAARQRRQACQLDFTRLDGAVERLAWKLAQTMPDCTTKTIESLRKHKLEHWNQNRESNRAWLSLNMNTEARAGFPAFHYGPKGDREVDFIKLRRLLAEGHPWDEALVQEISPAHEPVEQS